MGMKTRSPCGHDRVEPCARHDEYSRRARPSPARNPRPKHAQETGGGCERAHHEGEASDTALIVEIEILGLLQPQATDMTRGAQDRVLSFLELCLVVDAGEHFEHARQEFLEFTVPPKREPVRQWRNELNVLGHSGYCRSRIPRLMRPFAKLRRDQSCHPRKALGNDESAGRCAPARARLDRDALRMNRSTAGTTGDGHL